MLHFILPGYGNSGPGHWQTLWETEALHPSEDAADVFRRIDLGDWETPSREVWVLKLEAAVAQSEAPVILIAHSLACLLTVEWAAVAPAASVRKIKAALLVAPVDPAGPAFPASAQGFASVPSAPLPFPSLIVASEDDPYSTSEYALLCAHDWGSAFASIGEKGHINSSSGLGAWPQGRDLLNTLLHG